MANDVMIEAQQLSKMFGNVRALDKVSFKVRKGEVVGFLGPNGAGKSTTMRILTCFISSSGGSAKVRGVDVFDDPLEVRKSLGYLPQRAPLYGEMRVWDYLRFAADMRGIDNSTFKNRMKQVVEVCGLAKMLGKDISTLSHGYRQRVGLGQALIHNPPILILDEPTSDLDPNEKAEVIRYIKEIGKERTILLSTHNLAEVEAACARAIIVSKGRVVADGSLEDMRARTGHVRYVVTIDEKNVLSADGGYRKAAASPPTAQEVQDALGKVNGLTKIVELPTDESTHTFQMVGSHDEDVRSQLYKLVVDKGWILLEMRRETQTLEDVFMSLTRGDERADRGRALLNDEEAEEEALADEGDDEDEDDDEEEEDESEVVAKSAKAPPPKKPEPPKAAAKGEAAKAEEEDEEEDEEDEDDDEEEASDESDDEEEEDEDEKAASKKEPPAKAASKPVKKA